MRITVWEYHNLLVSINPARFDTEAELLQALEVQRHPDQEFYVRLEDADRCVNFMFDGSDGLDIHAVLCHRAMADVVFGLEISAIDRSGYINELMTPEEEILLARRNFKGG
jgi:hypothetical protein